MSFSYPRPYPEVFGVFKSSKDHKKGTPSFTHFPTNKTTIIDINLLYDLYNKTHIS